jgi:hypothetical protein
MPVAGRPVALHCSEFKLKSGLKIKEPDLQRYHQAVK